METGYYAVGKNGNLYQFEWDEYSKFYVKINKKFVLRSIKDYEIREIKFLTSDN